MSEWPTFHNHPPETVTITYSLEQHGWASMDVRIGGSHVRIGSISDCTDALGDLVRAAVTMATGAIDTQVIFDGESMLWGLSIEDGWQSRMRQSAHRFSIRTRPDHEGTTPLQVSSWPDVLAKGYVTADAFAVAVSKAAHEVLKEFGEDGYLTRWFEHPFPMRALVALDAALAVPLPPPPSGSPLSV